MTIERFFELAETDDAIAPNWYPDHPSLAQMRDWLEQLRDLAGIVEILLLVTDYDEGQPCVQEILFVSDAEPSGPAVNRLAFTGLGDSAAKNREVGGADSGG